MQFAGSLSASEADTILNAIQMDKNNKDVLDERDLRKIEYMTKFMDFFDLDILKTCI